MMSLSCLLDMGISLGQLFFLYVRVYAFRDCLEKGLV